MATRAVSGATLTKGPLRPAALVTGELSWMPERFRRVMTIIKLVKIPRGGGWGVGGRHRPNEHWCRPTGLGRSLLKTVSIYLCSCRMCYTDA